MSTATEDTELISIDSVGFRKLLSLQVAGKLRIRVKFLRTMSLFSGVELGTVGDRVLGRIAQVLVECTYNLGEVMARQNEVNDQAFMLLINRGRARVIREVSAGAATKALATFKPAPEVSEARISMAAVESFEAGPASKKAKGRSQVLPPPATKLTRAAHRRVEAYVNCAYHRGGPGATLPLELDILNKGDFYLRGYTTHITGPPVRASTSLIAKVGRRV